MCEYGKCDSEIRSRIAMGKAAVGQKRTILTNFGIGTETRMRLFETYVWSVILFGCEGWTVNKEMRRKLETVEMWFKLKLKLFIETIEHRIIQYFLSINYIVI